MSWTNAMVVVAMALALGACQRGEGELPYPDSQRQFVDLNRGCLTDYEAGVNEIQKSLAFKACNKSRTEFAAKSPIKNWLGTIDSISTDQGADVVSVRILTSINGFDITYRTVNNRLSDAGSASLITQDNPLFSALANLRVGQVVAFSGEFLRDPSGDRGVWESSLTERGSMEAPGFNLRFTALRDVGDEPGNIASPTSTRETGNPAPTTAVPPSPSSSGTLATEGQLGDVSSAAVDVKTYSSRKNDLLGRGYAPDANTSNELPHTVDGDPATCGNAGCQIPWSKGRESACVSVTVNDNLDEASWLSQAAAGPCTY